jgi:hypothetical protein
MRGGWSGLKNCRVLTKPFGSVFTVSFGLRFEGSTREFKTDLDSGTNAVVSLVGGPGFALCVRPTTLQIRSLTLEDRPSRYNRICLVVSLESSEEIEPAVLIRSAMGARCHLAWRQDLPVEGPHPQEKET